MCRIHDRECVCAPKIFSVGDRVGVSRSGSQFEVIQIAYAPNLRNNLYQIVYIQPDGQRGAIQRLWHHSDDLCDYVQPPQTLTITIEAPAGMPSADIVGILRGSLNQGGLNNTAQIRILGSDR